MFCVALVASCAALATPAQPPRSPRAANISDARLLLTAEYALACADWGSRATGEPPTDCIRSSNPSHPLLWRVHEDAVAHDAATDAAASVLGWMNFGFAIGMQRGDGALLTYASPNRTSAALLELVLRRAPVAVRPGF